MTRNSKLIVYVTQDLKDALDRVKAESRLSTSEIVRFVLIDYFEECATRTPRVPPYATRKALRDATLAVGRSPSRGRRVKKTEAA